MSRIFRGKRFAITNAGLMLILASSGTYGGAMGPEFVASPGKIYIGAFGGGGASTDIDLAQYGTAFYPPTEGGPLAVNAFGKFKTDSVGIVGGHVGYEWPEQLLSINPDLMLVAATELEGYYLGRSTLRGDDVNNGTARLTEHDFRVTYPMSTGVFLINAILNFHHADLGRFHPYVGVGIGTAVVSISGAKSEQTAPPEPGINHFNSNPHDTAVSFAAQPKAGFHFDLCQNVSLFAEYRFLYLSATDYMFGSTVYPTHVATSNWEMKMGSQNYNLGAVGIQYNL